MENRIVKGEEIRDDDDVDVDVECKRRVKDERWRRWKKAAAKRYSKLNSVVVKCSSFHNFYLNSRRSNLQQLLAIASISWSTWMLTDNRSLQPITKILADFRIGRIDIHNYIAYIHTFMLFFCVRRERKLKIEGKR